MAITYKSKITYKDTQESEPPPQEPGLFEKLGTEADRPRGAIQSMLRSPVSLGPTMREDAFKAIKNADEGWKNPSSVETFQHKNNRLFQEALPTDTNMMTRFQAGNLPSVIGLAQDFATDPKQWAIALGTEGLLKGLSPVKYKGISLGDRASNIPLNEGIQPKPGNFFASQEGATNAAIKARNSAVKLFPNQEGTLEQIRNTGDQTAKYVSKSKNYEDIANQMEMAKGINAGERQKLYDSGVLSEARSQHDPILKLIDEYENSPLASTKEGQLQIRKLKEIQTADADFLNNVPKEKLNDPNFYQEQKAIYQQKAKAAGSYKTDPSESLKADAYRAMAEGYQNKTYAVNDAVKPLNLEEGGLMKSHEMAREMAKQEAMGMKPSLAKEAAGSISGSPVQTGARFVRKGLLDRVFGSPAKGLTKSISKNMANSERQQSIVDLVAKMKEPETVPVDFNTPKQLTGPGPRMLESSGAIASRNRLSDIRGGRLLENQSGGKTIYGEGASQPIELPEYLDSRLSELDNQFGIGKNVRSSQPMREPSGSSPITESWKNLSPKERLMMNKLLERRKTNFGQQ